MIHVLEDIDNILEEEYIEIIINKFITHFPVFKPTVNIYC